MNDFLNNNRFFATIAYAIGISNLVSIDAKAFTEQKRMNIVFILADDLRWNSLGCMGNTIIKTPNIDAIANDGIRFENAYVTTSISCVSRASILTGQYMSRHNINNFNKAIPEVRFSETYPALLRDAGFYTGFVGKYGIGKVRNSDFDFIRSYEGRHWYPVNNATEEIIGEDENKRVITRINGDSVHVTDRNEADAIMFLKTRPKDKNFCLSLSFFAPHAEDRHVLQYRYKPTSEKHYQDVEIPSPETNSSESLHYLPPFIADDKCESKNRWYWRFNTPEKYQKYMKSYYRLITEMDEAIGRVVDELKKQGVYENTLIIFMGDNGYFHSEHQLAGKWYAYEESIRIPLIIYDSRISEKKRGKANNNIVLNIDIAPTIMAAANVHIPRDIQGKDLYPFYSSRKRKPIRKDFFYEHPYIRSELFIPSSYALVTRSEKYIVYPYYKYEEYFDLRKDPHETSNEISNIKYKKNIKKLKKRLLELKNMAK